MTAREYAALPEDDGVRYELAEGWLMMSPRPVPRHQRGIRELGRQLVPQLPGFEAGSTRIDTVVKHHEYADAGIGHYWMIDLQDGPSLVACHLAGEFGYQNAEPRRGVVATAEPFTVQVDLEALR